MNSHSKSLQSRAQKDFEKFFMKKMYPKKQLIEKQLAVNSITRAGDWSKEHIFNSKVIKTLDTGVTPLIHADLHDFRPRDKADNVNKSDVYVRHYLPASRRAEEVRLDHKSGYLEHTPFTPPIKVLEKSRVPQREVGPTIRYGLRTENERLKHYLDGANRLIDALPVDTRMLSEPTWRDIDKSKWISTKNFDNTMCYYQGRKSADPWNMTPIGINIGDKYIDGHEIVGDISRKRNKKLEIAPKDFITTVTPSQNSSNFLPPLDSTSLRTGKAGKFLGENDEIHKKIYPKTLRHLLANNPDFLLSPKGSGPSSEDKIIDIKAGSLDPLKESLASMTHTRSNMFSSTKDSLRRTGLGATRRLKDSGIDRSEYIKQTVKSYFD